MSERRGGLRVVDAAYVEQLHAGAYEAGPSAGAGFDAMGRLVPRCADERVLVEKLNRQRDAEIVGLLSEVHMAPLRRRRA